MKIQTDAEFYQELDRLRQRLRQEEQARKQGVPGLGLYEELNFINGELEKLAVQAAKRPLPAQPQRLMDAGDIVHILVEAWPYDDPLANDLLDLCHYYRDKLGKP